MDTRTYRGNLLILGGCVAFFALGAHYALEKLTVQLNSRSGYWEFDIVLLILAVVTGGIGVLGFRRIEILHRESVDREQVEKALRESEEYARILFETMQTGLVVIDKSTRVIIDVNPAAQAMIGAPREKIVGLECHNHICPNDRGQCPIADHGQTIDRSERVLLRSDGSRMPVLKSVASTIMSGSECLIETLTDLSERKALEDQLKELAVTDEITGVLNRRGFIQLAEKQMRQAQRMGSQVYLIYADIDNMKWINDTLGHEAGDRAIAETAQLLCCTLRSSDLIGCGRLGGDEFALLLTGDAGGGKHPVLRRLQDNLIKLNANPGREYQLAISFGQACHDPAHPQTIDELFHHADQVMYEVKRRRKEIANKNRHDTPGGAAAGDGRAGGGR